MGEYAQVEAALGQRITESTQAEWGFQNRTDLAVTADGERIVVQWYRLRADGERRVRVMRPLCAPAAAKGIDIPRIRAMDLDGDPVWVVYDALSGVPMPAAGDARPGGPRFPAMARLMGEWLVAFRDLPSDELGLGDLWRSPTRLADHALRWSGEIMELTDDERARSDELTCRAPELFAGRPTVLAHGDFVPMNVLTDGRSLTGLLDFESVRLTDPLFDPAWWAWSVGFAGEQVLAESWPQFLAGAGISPDEPGLAERVHMLQVLRMLELLADASHLEPGIRATVLNRLKASI